MSNASHKQSVLLLFISIACMCYALVLRADVALQQATTPALRPHAVLRLSIAGNDFGADAWPARVGAAGYIEVWAMMADAEDERTLVQIVGAPALKVGPRMRPIPQRENNFESRYGKHMCFTIVLACHKAMNQKQFRVELAKSGVNPSMAF